MVKTQALERRYGIYLNSNPARAALAAYLLGERLSDDYFNLLQEGTYEKVAESEIQILEGQSD